MQFLLVSPIVIPLLTAAFCLIAWGRPLVRNSLNVTGALALFGCTVAIFVHVRGSGFAVVHVGNWAPPFGIVLVADLLSAMMLLVVGLVAVLVAVYQLGAPASAPRMRGASVIYQILLMGVCGAYLAGDVFNLYVWFEVMLIGSFVLMTWGAERGQLVGSLKYVTLNLIASALFLAAVGLLYARFGTLNLADLAQLQGEPGAAVPRGRLLALLFLASFGIKAAIFPFFFWLPESYPNAPAAIGGLFAALLTKVGVYALLRVFTLVFSAEIESLRLLLMILAASTMLLGVFGAMAQEEIRAILSFHIVSQIGYMIMGLAVFTPLALAATIFFVVHNIIAKTNLFLVGGIVEDLAGSTRLARLGGLFHRRGLLGILFLTSALSLAGLPPLAGFWAKVALIAAGLHAGQHAIVAVAVFVSLLTLFSMMKIWTRVFWGEESRAPQPGAAERLALWRTRRLARYAPVIVLAVAAAAMGVFAQPLLGYSERAAEQLLDPSLYVEAVLGARP